MVSECFRPVAIDAETILWFSLQFVVEKKRWEKITDLVIITSK
jgi:hypothetical protein